MYVVECFFRAALSIRFQLFLAVSYQPLAWDWAWGVEDVVYPSSSNTRGRWWTLNPWTRSTVTFYYLSCFVCLTHLCSFRLIPTFGRDTIRRFTSNTSELKQMAARNYEDFLQVSHFTSLVIACWLLLVFHSVLSPFLTVYYRNPTMGMSSNFSLPSLTGMVLPNYECTLTPHLLSLITKQPPLVNSFAIFSP